jgi:hypothetical protein
MIRVKLEEPCVLEGRRYEKDDVVDVSEQTQELNSVWMKPAEGDAKVTPADSRPTAEEFAAKEKADAEKAAAKEKAAAEKAAAKDQN